MKKIIFIALITLSFISVKAQYKHFGDSLNNLNPHPGDVVAKRGLIGALTLYLDFINLFVMLLQLTGQRRDQ